VSKSIVSPTGYDVWVGHDGSLESQGSHRKAGSSSVGEKPGLPVAVVTLCTAIGLLVIAAAYTAGRLGYASSPWADRAYWTGQGLILIPTAIRLLGRRTLTEGGTIIVVGALAVAEYLGKVCYSPTGFTYSDELAHLRTAESILQTGKLFTVNYSLPISPQYPGLEEVTSAMVSITGLSLFTCGLIVAGIAHLLFVCSLYLIFRHVSGSHRVAGIAILIYSTNPDLPFFDSMFAYQTLAEAFLGVALLTAWGLASAETFRCRASWLTLSVIAITATVATHHVTSYILLATLLLIALASLLVGDLHSAGWSFLLGLLTATAVACWIAFVAPDTISYLQPVRDDVLNALHAGRSGGHAPAGDHTAAPVSSVPLGNEVLAGGAVLLLSAMLPFGWWQVWRRYRRNAWSVALAIGSISWYLVIAVRLAVPDGTELAGRASSFVFVPAAFIASLVVTRLIGVALRWQASAVAAAALAGVLLMMFDGMANGWPPYWERLPGPHQVAGVERSVGPEEIDVAKWTLAALGPGNRFAADFGNTPILGSYGDQNPVLNDSLLYTSPSYSRADVQQVQAQSISYILVDLRLSQSLPASGQYFPIDPNADRYNHPIPLADLTKFNRVPGVARIFDAGNIVVYSLNGASNAP
jgi:hypothetical protein